MRVRRGDGRLPICVERVSEALVPVSESLCVSLALSSLLLAGLAPMFAPMAGGWDCVPEGNGHHRPESVFWIG